MRRLLTTFALALAASMPTAGARAQEVEAPSEAADAAEAASTARSEQLVEIPAPQIGRRIEETFRALQEVAPRLRRQRKVRRVRDELPAFILELEHAQSLPALGELDALSPRRLLDLEQEWSRISGRLQAWQSILERRSDGLAEERLHVRRARLMWILTRDAERDEPLPTSQLERIERLLERIDLVARRLDLRLTEVLDLQSELSDQGIRISANSARINAARSKAREDREERDHEPLWVGGEALRDARPEPSPGPILLEHLDSLGTFLHRDRARLTAQLTLFLLMAFLLSWVRHRRGAAPVRQHPTPLRALRSRPIASAALLALVLTPLMHPHVPSVVRGIVLVLMVPTLVRLAPFLLPRPQRPVLLFLLMTMPSVLVALGYAPAPLRRLMLLALALGGVALGVQMQLRRRQRGDAPGLLDTLLTLAALPLCGAAYLNAVGYVERAAVWVDGAYTVVEMTIVIQFALALAGGLIVLGARHRLARYLRILRTHRRRATQTVLQVLRWAGVGAVFYTALVGFDVLDPLSEALRLALRKTYEFGSIELSVGDVLSFGLVIAGTFVVVRLVHFLLSREILPRFELGAGTEAAISLTVSYLIVALGVILAFGLAGVDPEQLALLGGALGVGIGFGLQNVVSNFVSGLILVAERPIKVGDVIEIGELVGSVQRIGIRSSTVRSLTGAEVIVPNSELISGQLVNWTLSDARRRVDLSVGTGYQHDPTMVLGVLQRVIDTQPGIQHDPPPEVLCKGFGDSSIDFVIRFWTNEYTEAVRLRSALSRRVYTALEREGIEIPFPIRDVRLRKEPPAEEEPEAEEASPA